MDQRLLSPFSKWKLCSREGYDLCKATLYNYVIPTLMFFLLCHGPLNQDSLHPQWDQLSLTSPYFQGQGAGSLRAHLVSSGWSFQWLVTGPPSSPSIEAFCLNCWRHAKLCSMWYAAEICFAFAVWKLQTPKHWIGAQEAWECLVCPPQSYKKGNISSANSWKRQGRCI